MPSRVLELGLHTWHHCWCIWIPGERKDNFGCHMGLSGDSQHLLHVYSKYRVHKLWLVSCVQMLVKLEFNNVQELESIDASSIRSTNVQLSSTI